jgi:hypothetical protein
MASSKDPKKNDSPKRERIAIYRILTNKTNFSSRVCSIVKLCSSENLD